MSSDFISNGWSVFVAAATILGLVFCVVLLVIASRRKVMANDNTTGHTWDEDLRELNNPLPRWWMGLFVITVVFAGAYLALYPGLGSAEGTLKWSSTGQYQAEQEKARAALNEVYAKFAGMPAEQLAGNTQAMGIGERLFANNCATCHGSDAKGSKGFPNLTDADWLYGGAHETIVETIAKGRIGQMPPMGAAVGSADDVRNLAHYVLSLSGSPHNSVSAQLGKAKFGACAACHGADGKGNQALGAPNLTDKIWLHGWGEEAVVSIINNGKTNQMPAHAERLSPEQVRVLGAYVWSLSNGAGKSVTR
ncbi:cytochrome-c oxidase, cbb3-type subunit III [Kinneretia asaccharophila]|uniref:Cbb3-type cytochrome c oxidase subunit n=1 Tax=Roseateles asaccharophilus TaxID=582607 RepID=A0A4V3CK13_9BURK|nr:cytochrome-c oxidase, cbb3-type subunit III [Roseateles asaccharophilus]MDN3543786.1 cytochrome-c oxidase, cbb3-type subunit III [Roseateles asaccharophilus]TDP11836.1 cytochrome c oxidase cbb3-type subunit 3 [Roseateles asaccharophilus]